MISEEENAANDEEDEHGQGNTTDDVEEEHDVVNRNEDLHTMNDQDSDRPLEDDELNLNMEAHPALHDDTNIVTEASIVTEVVHEVILDANGGEPQPPQPTLEEISRINQRRQPKKDDFVSFWEGDHWSQVQIITRVRGYKHYYNCRRDTGETLGIYCKPASIDQSYFWSLVEPPLQPGSADREVLRCSSTPSSAAVSPAGYVVRQEPLDAQHEASSLDLTLQPFQIIQRGRVHTLPSPSNNRYRAAVERRLHSLLLPPEQEHMRMGIAMTMADNDIAEQDRSLSAKVKRFWPGKKFRRQ